MELNLRKRITHNMKFLLPLLFFCLTLDSIQAQNISVKNRQELDSNAVFSRLLKPAIAAANKAVVNKIGQKNFNTWTDSIVISWKSKQDKPDSFYADSLKHPESYSFLHFYYEPHFEFRYSFKIPQFGKYVARFRLLLLNDISKPPYFRIEKYHPQLPKCVNCSIIAPKTALSIALKHYKTKDTTMLENNFLYGIIHFMEPIQGGAKQYKKYDYCLWTYAFNFATDSCLFLNAIDGKKIPKYGNSYSSLDYVKMNRKKSHTKITPPARNREKITPPTRNRAIDTIVHSTDCNHKNSLYAPVTGVDGRCYVNKQYVEKLGIKILHEGYNKNNYNNDDEYTWPIEPVCESYSYHGYAMRWIESIRMLDDGTFILRKYNFIYTDGVPKRVDEPTYRVGVACSDVFDPVCTKSGRIYFNNTVAELCHEKIVATGNCNEISNSNDTLRWPIETVEMRQGGPALPPYPKIIRYLGDRTCLVQKKAFGEIYRACIKWNYVEGKCLPPSAKISTPIGETPINKLKQGDTVWTVNKKGEKIAVPIRLTNKVKVADTHQMVRIEMADGRKLQVTPGHPSAIVQKTIGEFEIGDTIDGSVIIKKSYIAYKEQYTYDILPQGETGFYWANGILIGSTLTQVKLDARNNLFYQQNLQ